MTQDSKLPEGWQMVKFGDLVRNVREAERDPLSAGLERYVGLEHMEPENLHIKEWGLIEEGTSFTQKFVKGQVLFGKRRAYQRKVAVAEFDGVSSGDILVFEPKDDRLLPGLLPFIVQSEGFFTNALRTSSGSLSPRTRWRDLAAYELPLLPLDEQRRIAEILWAADETKERWRAAREGLETLRASIREEFICNSQYPRRRLETCLKNIVAGKSVRGRNEPAQPDEYGVLKVSAVGPRGFAEDENKTLPDFGDFLPESRVRAGDVLITRCNTRELVGRVCIVPRDYDNLMLCDKTLRLDVREDLITKKFVIEALRSREARIQIEAAATGTGGAMKNISQADIQSFKIPLPDIETQQRIEAVIDKALAAQHSVETHLAHSSAFYSTLREKLLNPPSR
jgi:type I restriction enzyme S subunit